MPISKPNSLARKSVFPASLRAGGFSAVGDAAAVALVLAVLLVAGCDSGGGSEPPSNQAPRAAFTAEAVEGEPMTYAFDAGESNDPNGEIAVYDWEFGDGGTATGRAVDHTYESGGEMDVTLMVVDGEGASASSTETISVEASGASYDFTSDYAYNVNVIYFVPEGMEPLPNYRERMSGFMLYIQDYYRQWMNHWGYEDRTFGLLKDEEAGRIKIYRIDGEDPVSAYSNGRTIRAEVRDYFESIPDVSPDSEHYLVFTPKPESDLDLPYYAIGKWGFVSDIGQNAEEAPGTGGGVVHELGHALNVPHNAHPISVKQEIGTAIMHNGNNVWNHGGGASATSLTEVSVGILSEAQATAREEESFYGPVDAELRSASGTYRNGEIVISGTFESDEPVRKAAVMLDPEGGGTYDQAGFVQTITGADSFHVSVPLSELPKTQSADYTAKVWLIPENHGRIYKKLTEFSFENGEPNIDFQFGTVSTISKEEWEIESFSDQETQAADRPASNVIDGDWDTFWHSEYTPSRVPHPHTLTVDMGESQEVKGFQFVNREAGGHDGGTRIEEVEIKVSDDGADWQSLGTFTLDNTRLPQQVELDSAERFRYFRLITKSNWQDSELASLAEVGAFAPPSGAAAAERSFRKPAVKPVESQATTSDRRD